MPFLTKRRRILGLPIGRRRTNWAGAGRLAAMGAGAVAATAGALRTKSAVDDMKDKASEQARTATQAMGKVGDAAGQVSKIGNILPGGGKGGEGEGEEREEVKKLRLVIKEAIDIAVPLTTAYNQWTQFEELPKIMGSVQGVEQEADDETRWTVKIGPSARDWTAKILEQVPDQRIKWESTEGATNRGVVTFHRLDDRLTRIQVEMEYVPSGIVEKVGNVFLAARRRTRNDLRQFKHHMELVGKESGGWRGEIHADGEKAAQGDGSEQAEQAEESEQAGGSAPGDESQQAEQGEQGDQPARRPSSRARPRGSTKSASRRRSSSTSA